MKRLAITAAVILALTSAPMAQRGTTPKPLDIYVVDTEGGKAALWVAPTGQSLLIDSGNPGNRDGDRIMAAVNDAGLKQIDFLISTHYHVDHIGGMLKTPLPGGGKPNPACAGVAPKEASPTDENAMSVGSLITFGQFRAIDL